MHDLAWTTRAQPVGPLFYRRWFSGKLGDLMAFLAVAEERSFTRAAAKRGVSQSARSYTMRRLETRLGLRLLNRTTRSVAATEGGERLLRTLRPAFDQIDSELDAVSELRDKPAGTIRIIANDHAANTILWPAISRLLPDYPDIKLEIDIDYGLTDIVADRYHAGVRFGDRQPSAGGLYAWEFEKRGRELRVRVDGQLVFNSVYLILKVADSSRPPSACSSIRCASKISRSTQRPMRVLAPRAFKRTS